MLIEVLAIGKASKDYIPLFNEYSKRLGNKLKITELEIKAKTGNIKELEAKKIKDALDPKSYKIIMDEQGELLTSREFANKISNLTQNNSHITFIIGGASGFAEEIYKLCHYKLALGKMTLAHMLARLVLLEQIYRAFTINENHPYHK